MNFLNMAKLTIIILITTSCVFKFDVPSAKTKLEKQVLGYKPKVPKEMLMKIVTRSDSVSSLSRDQLIVLRERLRGQITTALQRGSIGESNSGRLILNDENRRGFKMSAIDLAGLDYLIREENSVRTRLAEIDASEATEYSYEGVEGAWYEDEDGNWEINN